MHLCSSMFVNLFVKATVHLHTLAVKEHNWYLQHTQIRFSKYQTSENNHLHQSFDQSSVHGIHKEDTSTRLPQDKK